MRVMILILALLLSAAPLAAEPEQYLLETDKSQVMFEWDFGQDAVSGTMQVARADLLLDFARVANSHIDVDINVASARAGFPFASQAMKGPQVLDAKRFPLIQFISTNVEPRGAGALVQGNVTVRGVTRPMTLIAEIFRERGSDANDFSHLIIILTGMLQRSKFGAGGFAGFAGDEIRLRIQASIRRGN